ncbi:MAG: hypothetical protein IKQ05_01800 [Prevotella sp.]|nr:hypothetical protein [Prevotella sp.]
MDNKEKENMGQSAPQSPHSSATGLQGKNTGGLWNRILSAVLKMPGVRVNRVEFLRSALHGYVGEQKLDLLPNVRPYTITTDKVIDEVAAKCINRHTALATTGSTLAGLPGGLAMMATIPGDLTQYYYHVVVLSQKLAYLYGFPDFNDENDELSDVASDLLTIFMGAMMGVKVADQGISQIARGVATSAVSRLPRVAITKAAVYPIAMQVARLVGMRLTKSGFTRTVGKLIPIAAGVFSGTLTLFTFKPGARRLQKRLKAQKQYFGNADAAALEQFWEKDGETGRQNIRASFTRAEQSQDRPQEKQLAMLQAMVNMANIADNLSPEMQDLIEERVAQSDLTDEQQLSLLEHLGTEYSIDADYDLLACDPDYARDCIRALIDVMRVAGRQSVAEKMYLSMTAKAVGIAKDELEEMISAPTPNF